MNKETLTKKQYLGDGVYVGWDGFNVWLFTDNGISVTNQIALEPQVIDTLKGWLERL